MATSKKAGPKKIKKGDKQGASGKKGGNKGGGDKQGASGKKGGN